LMGLELVGSRVLAPYFGGSIFVWGSLIGIFLAALSLGYYLGGLVADRFPRPAVLAALLGGAGGLTLAIPKVFPPVCESLVLADLGPRLGPLLGSVALFFLPSLLLGTAAPFAIRLAARSLERVGSLAGTLYAVSTSGSIFGTLATAFYLIPVMGRQAILYLLGAALVAVAMLTGLLECRRSRDIGTALLALLLLPAGPAAAGGLAGIHGKVVRERDTPYHHILVVDEGGYRYLRSDNLWHSRMSLSDPASGGLAYTDYFDLALAFNPNLRKVLMIGLGGGTGVKRFLRDYGEMTIESVEIDPAIVEIARQYFGVTEGPRHRIRVQDGRIFLARSKERYDLIILDAYYADSLPFYLTTKEFFALAAEHLNPGGVFFNNLVGPLEGPKNKLFRSIYRTLEGAFGRVYVFPVWETASPGRPMNLELVAVKNKAPSKEELVARARQLEGKMVRDNQLARRAAGMYTKPVATSDVPLLTDDYAPVDALIHLW